MEKRASSPFLLREATGVARDAALDLLEAAGWSRAGLSEWASRGTVLELYDPADDVPRGAAVVEAVWEATYELKAWAATVDTAEPAVPERLVRGIADALRRAGGRRVVASVGDGDPDRLTLLLEAGFRFAAVERNTTLASRGGPCDGSRDLIWMGQDL